MSITSAVIYPPALAGPVGPRLLNPQPVILASGTGTRALPPPEWGQLWPRGAPSEER